MQNATVREKMKATNIKNLGCEYSFQNAEVKEKIKTTNIERYGSEYPMQNTIVQEKAKATSLENWGCEYPMQNVEVFERNKKAQFKRKLYSFPSGKDIYIQGYEAFALDLLLSQGIKEEDLLFGFNTMPQIIYEHNGALHRYYPDIFIASQNKIIEVKSEYTYNISREIVYLKIQACLATGLKAEIWIFSNKGALLRVVDE